jgi:hypothetical protein
MKILEFKMSGIGLIAEFRRILNEFPNLALTRITDVPPIMLAPNPTKRQALQLTKRTQSRRTRNNVPGSIPLITNTAVRCHVPLPLPDVPIVTATQRSTRIHTAPMQPAITQWPKV